MVPDLDYSALKEIGVPKVGDRLRLLLAIQQASMDRLRSHVPIDVLMDFKVNSSDAPLASRSGEDIRGESTITPADDSEAVKNTMTVITQDGATKKVSVAGCFNAMSIKRKALKKLGIKSSSSLWDAYVTDREGVPRLMFDVELVTVCHSADRIEKHRIILCPKMEKPSTIARETSRRQIEKSLSLGNRTKRDGKRKAQDENTGKTGLRSFFGQRPPSQLISTNLAEYFPDSRPNQLQETMRNSVRLSARMSRIMPNGALAGSRASMFSNSSQPISLVSSRLSVYHSGAAPSVGEVIVNNANAIDSILADDASIADQYDTIRPVISQTSAQSGPKLSAAMTAPDMSDRASSVIELLDENDDLDEMVNEDYDLMEQLSLEEESGPQRWHKGARIGAGSFGTVYLGLNSLTGELMAVKQVEIPSEGSKTEQHKRMMIDALKMEMTLLRDLNHPNIVRYLGSSSDSANLNIFLEYIPGGSVSSMLNTYGPFEEPLIRSFVSQILIGLQYLHSKNIIHRDIKGANILIDINGTVKISDFGISKRVEGVSETSTPTDGPSASDGSGSTSTTNRRASLQGSVYWMAPEVVKQSIYTDKADVWSLGCLIVEMYTGKHPFPNYSQMQAIFKIGTHTIPDIPAWATDDARRFLGVSFELDHTKRPSAAQLLQHAFLKPLLMPKLE
ncbi:unnamed protein product [Kuraishia capsulata CBS 1993]|uniref:Protein kinase domain-containing protein n=1 Tax=Kuraishia capsulata CBS 1993 TaxID=1382522 RepID=W6MLF6_9ASCO|nr:uncharacterized protein KUCA_T00002920001 [Kuraishia capsulata CBS 1993]CDK26943.1 unnamed protein product [Kuraishia capsulata CBS 1993]